jgi:hypothetical protein
LRHHLYNPNFNFVKEPAQFNKNSSKKLLQFCLGATLYTPGTKDIREVLISKNRLPGLTSLVLDCEDSISKFKLSKAEKTIISTLEYTADALNQGELENTNLPLLFIRVRNVDHFKQFSKKLSKQHLEILKNILQPYKKFILNIRVGATDFSSIFSLRRGIDFSIYDLAVVKECLSDIINYFCRDEEGYVISGPVWEYFSSTDNLNLDEINTCDFYSKLFKDKELINKEVDGLLREVILDRLNGFIGKTIIHPSHIRYVNALQAITEEGYSDAKQIKASGGQV